MKGLFWIYHHCSWPTWILNIKYQNILVDVMNLWDWEIWWMNYFEYNIIIAFVPHEYWISNIRISWWLVCEIERFYGWIILNLISSFHLPHMNIEYQISDYLGGCLIMNIEYQISKYLGGCHHRGVWLGPSRDTGDRRREAVGHKLLSRSSSG